MSDASGTGLVEVRPAHAADAAAIQSVRFRSWRQAYGPLLPDHVWSPPSAEATARLAGRLDTGEVSALVAAAHGDVLGYALYGPARDDDLPDAGEVYAVYADPDHWSTGVGRALLGGALDMLGVRPVVLWVLEANARARRFYEIAGFRADGTHKSAEMPGGVQLPEMRYRRA